MKIHKRALRLYVNAGIRFPLCYANAPLLDLDKTILPTTGEDNEVTCKNCKRITLHRGFNEMPTL